LQHALIRSIGIDDLNFSDADIAIDARAVFGGNGERSDGPANGRSPQLLRGFLGYYGIFQAIKSLVLFTSVLVEKSKHQVIDANASWVHAFTRKINENHSNSPPYS
jgi:hypothetical protein